VKMVQFLHEDHCTVIKFLTYYGLFRIQKISQQLAEVCGNTCLAKFYNSNWFSHFKDVRESTNDAFPIVDEQHLVQWTKTSNISMFL
jgi:hypothetical protein